MLRMIKKLLQRKSSVSYSVSKHLMDELTDYELAMLNRMKTCPDCNVANSLIEHRGEPFPEVLLTACTNCGAQFNYGKVFGRRLNTRGHCNASTLRARFRFTDDMLASIWQRKDQLERFKFKVRSDSSGHIEMTVHLDNLHHSEDKAS